MGSCAQDLKTTPLHVMTLTVLHRSIQPRDPERGHVVEPLWPTFVAVHLRNIECGAFMHLRHEPLTVPDLRCGV